MDLQDTSCCALVEISYLQAFKSPEEAMKSFCESLDPSDDDDYWDYNYYDRKSKMGKPDGFYLFTEVSKTYYKPKNGKPAKNNIKTGYGAAFASYIKANKLGIVTVSPMRRNRRNHPEHGVKVYVWAPSEKGLKAWAEKHKVF